MRSVAEFIDVQHVEQVFETRRGPVRALRDVDLAIAGGEVVTLIGHAGCGKSTLLNLVAGLLRPTQGVLLCDGREIGAPGPDRAVVFPHDALLPWLTSFGNVHLAVERVFGAREGRAQLRERVMQALELVGMAHATHRRPHELAPGARQRVALARALAMAPRVLLLDEPFGALDALTRAQLEDDLLKIVERLACTVLMATHDVDEAVLLSDRIVLMTHGPAATVGAILLVDLPRPRDRIALADDARYVHCRRQLTDFLHTRRVLPGTLAGG